VDFSLVLMKSLVYNVYDLYFERVCLTMGFLDYFFWFVAIFAAVYGIFLLVAPKKTLIAAVKKQLAKKGNNDPTDEEVAKKLKMFRICGVVCIVASGILFALLLTGGIFAF